MRIKSIISSSIGNILEWYDFGLFAIYSSLFSQLFFPAVNPHLALIATLSVFAIGFFCRPIGALLFGYMGDRQGRVKTLRLSILMISLPTLLVGFIPTYAMIGIGAPILLTLIRIWQGISLGGEYSGNLIYLAETAPISYRATIASLASTGANLGILLASLVSMLSSSFLTDPAFKEWGWRIPYLLSGALCLFVYYLRLQMQETVVFEYLKTKKLLEKNPIVAAFKNNMPQILRTVGLVCMGSTFYYFCFLYLPTFLTQDLQFSSVKITRLMMVFIGAMIVLVPLAGMLCDRIGRRKMLLFNAFFIAVVTIPGFYFLGQHMGSVLLILIIFTIASSLEQGTTAVTVVENFPPSARYTGLSLGYNLGNALFGGTAPLVCAWLTYKTHFSLAPAFYIVLCAMVTGLIVYFFVRETRGVALV